MRTLHHATRRRAITLGGLTLSAVALSMSSRSWSAEPVTQSLSSAILFGRHDLNELPAVDSHIHDSSPLAPMDARLVWGRSFAAAAMDIDGPIGDAPSSDLVEAYTNLFDRLPSSIGLRQYIARQYNVPDDLQSVSAVVKRQLEGGLGSYFRRKLDSSAIKRVVLQSADPEPVRPESIFPDERFSWTYSLNPLLQPDWAISRGLTDVSKLADSIIAVMQTCAENNCVGFKVPIAYYRPIAVGRVSRNDAQAALDTVLSATPDSMRNAPTQVPVFEDAATTAALWTYQDYLLRRLFLAAGELDKAIVIHSAVAVHPGLRLSYNDPSALYDVFSDRSVLEAGTRFVIIHAGYPHHHAVAAFMSQFPNVYSDVSFFSHQPGTLEEILRVFLGSVPMGKVMHGSDWSTPEAMGYSVDNTRRILARILDDYVSIYRGGEEECLRIAKGVLSETAHKAFKLP